VFPNENAHSKHFRKLSSLGKLSGGIQGITRPSKAALPLLKLAKFGREPSAAGCLRYDANLTAVCGAEGDYDGLPLGDGRHLTIDAAAVLAQAQGLEALFYETPSSTPDEPRWRVLLPASQEYPGTEGGLRAQRARWVARVNGLLGGVLAPESFRLSQSFYAGNVEGKPPIRIILTKGSRIDLRDNLDATALYPKGKAEPPACIEHVPVPEGLEESDDDPRLLRVGGWRKTWFLRKEAKTGTPTATGDRAFRLVMWLADMRTADGRILSASAITEILGDDFPHTTAGAVRTMLARKGQHRGCSEIDL
jgi:hypothetical protein